MEKRINHDLTADKAKLRKQMKDLRAGLQDEERGRLNGELLENLTSISAIVKSPVVYCYVDVRHEAGTRDFIGWALERGIRVAVPRVDGKGMAFYYITGWNDLQVQAFGIPEPAAACRKAEETTAPVIVPGLAFTAGGRRLGYGGGYYDRFLEREPCHLKLGVAYPFQIVNDLPVDSHDILMDGVITPRAKIWV